MCVSRKESESEVAESGSWVFEIYQVWEHSLESQDLQRLLSNRETLRTPWDFTITRNNYKPLEKTLWIIKSSKTFTYLQRSWCCHVGVQTQTQWFYLSVLVSRVCDQVWSIVCSRAKISLEIQVCFWKSKQKNIQGLCLFWELKLKYKGVVSNSRCLAGKEDSTFTWQVKHLLIMGTWVAYWHTVWIKFMKSWGSATVF